MPDRRLDRLARTRDHNVEVLRAAGWSVAEAGAADTIPEVWNRATGGDQVGGRPHMVVLPQGGGR
jgi:hypothetical protein